MKRRILSVVLGMVFLLIVRQVLLWSGVLGSPSEAPIWLVALLGAFAGLLAPTR